ncbi:MAG: hypothetical protein ACKVU4_00570 [Phycisphaerales bacterium]
MRCGKGDGDGDAQVSCGLRDADPEGALGVGPDRPVHARPRDDRSRRRASGPQRAAISATTGKVHIGASLAGELVHVVPNGIDLSPGSAFTELRFRGASGEVCEMRVLGGEIDTTTGMDNTTLAQAFQTLSFLVGP